MDIDYKSLETANSTSFKNPDEFRTNIMKKKLTEQIEILFKSGEQENYELMIKEIKILNFCFQEKFFGIHEIISPYPIMNFLINATQIPQITQYALQCISNLIPINPDEYQTQILQYPAFIDFLFNVLNDNKSDYVYDCVSLINNMVEAFQSNSEPFIKSMNFASLKDFSMIDIENAELSLKLMTKIVLYMSTNEMPKEVKLDILKIFIHTSHEIFHEFKHDKPDEDEYEDFLNFREKEPIIPHQVLNFLNTLITFYYPTVTTLIDLELIRDILNLVTPSSTNLILAAINFYTIIVNEGIQNPDFLGLSKYVMADARIDEIIEWVKELSLIGFLCQSGYKLLSLLIEYQSVYEIKAVKLITKSSVVASAVSNIKECSFKQKLKLFQFIVTFIENANPEIITNDINSNMFFGLFDDLIHQHYEKNEMNNILDLITKYIKLFQFCQSSNDILLEAIQSYDFTGSLNELLLDDEYGIDDVLVGKIKIILEILSEFT